MGTLEKLLFIGDYCPSCEFIERGEEVQRSLLHATTLKSPGTLSFINLECSIVSKDAQKTTEITLEGIPPLSCLSPGIVNLANNHFFDHGGIHVEEIIQKLRDLHLHPVGLFQMGQENYDILTVGSCTVGVISRVSKGSNPTCWKKDGFSMIPLEHDEVVKAAKHLRSRVEILIVSLHWGAEYYAAPSPWQRLLANDLLKVGVDVLWGHHAHRLQPLTICGKVLALYNLGNFLFGGVAAGRWPEESRKSALVIYNLSSFSAEYRITSSQVHEAVHVEKETKTPRVVTSLRPTIIDYCKWPIQRMYRELFIYGIRYLSKKIRPRIAEAPARPLESSPEIYALLRERLRRCIRLKIDE